MRQAAEQVEHTEAGRQKVLVLYLPDCHESLAGIVAGRIRERYCRPVFVITDSGEMAKGSGRSIEAYHMYEEMNKCRNLFVKFGGHKLAAGLTLKKENIEKFRQDINAVCTLTETDMTEKVSIDMQMPFSCVTEELLEELKLLEPLGKGNTKPVFAEKNVSIVSCRLIGKNRNMLRMRLCDGAGTDMDAVYFGDAVGFLEEVGERYGKTVRDHFFEGGYRRIRLSVTYYPGVNEYMGQKTMQIVVTHYQIV